jgi:peptidoglycan/xylan/chitin deacetylase (PgdA/CDA1 family)
MAPQRSTFGVCIWAALFALAQQSAYQPAFVVRDFSGEWWQQVSVEPEAASVDMEVVGGERWTMRPQSWGDFTSGEHIVTGTPVQLIATRADGDEAISGPFRYLVDAPGSECVPDCAGLDCGDDGCGGSCGACEVGFDCEAGLCVEEPPVSLGYDPDFEVASSSGEWWVQVEPHGGAETVLLEVETGDEAYLDPQPWGHFTGGHHIATGTLVRLTGTDVEGRVGRTFFFAWLVEDPVTDPGDCEPDCTGLECGDDGCGGSCGTCDAGWDCESGLCIEEPVCVPDCAGLDCGDDGCGGSCGSCSADTSCVDGACSDECVPPWDPVWTTELAGEFWIEFSVSGGADVVAVLLEVEGREDLELSYRYGKWYGPSGAHVPRGASCRLHAEHRQGPTASTHSFAYLDEEPVTDPCGGSGPPACLTFEPPMLTIAFDDAWASQQLAVPALEARGLRANFFLLVTPMVDEWGGYLTVPAALAMVSGGQEVGSHSMDHPRLTHLSEADITWQLATSQHWLQTTFDQPVAHFAAPYTAIDERVVTIAAEHYDSLCCINGGLNTRGQDPYRLRAEYVVSPMTVGEATAFIDDAIDVGGWQILGFHQISLGPSSDPYAYPLADLEAILDYAVANGVDVVTYSEGVARLPCE